MELRRATIDDAEILLSWRNEKETRQASFSRDAVSRDEHLAWLAERLAPMHAESVWMINDSDDTIGTGRIRVIDDAFAEISIVIDSALRNDGRGRQAIRLLSRKVQQMQRTPIAFVRTDNERSIRAFSAAGFYTKRFDDERMELWA
jgi:RimJ/RimL family protein N-acetyltransferase